MESIYHFIDSSGHLLAEDAIGAGIDKSSFYDFVKNHRFEKVSPGLYITPESWSDEAFILHTRCPQAIFSHDEALYHHGLIDREPQKPTITIYTSYNTKRLTQSGVKVFTVKRELLEIGKTTYTNSFGHNIPIYDLERTICDLIRSRSRFEIQDFQSALKSYVSRKDKDLTKLMEYAKLFHVDRIIRRYMEVLL